MNRYHTFARWASISHIASLNCNRTYITSLILYRTQRIAEPLSHFTHLWSAITCISLLNMSNTSVTYIWRLDPWNTAKVWYINYRYRYIHLMSGSLAHCLGLIHTWHKSDVWILGTLPRSDTYMTCIWRLNPWSRRTLLTSTVPSGANMVSPGLLQP